MAITRVTAIDGMTAVLLPPDVAEQFGLRVGDSVDIVINDRSLVITRAISAEERAERIRSATEEVLRRRADAYRALAQIEES